MEVILVRSCHLQGDSRSSKMIADYEKWGFQVTPLVWTRGVAGPLPAGTIAFTKKGLQGARFRNAWYFFRWHQFLLRFFLTNWRRRFVLHCVDFDTALVSVPMARLLRKTIVYDAFDHFASSREGAFAPLFHVAEKVLIEKADILILPDDTRMEQYGLNPDRVWLNVIANIPDGERVDVARRWEGASPASGPIHIVYVGTLEAEHRGLEFIPRLCEAFPDTIRFTVGGNGALDGFFRDSGARLPNLDYVGYQSYEDALRIMLSADVLYGPYLLSSKNHPFAAPNKMFEHLALGRPLITNDGTPPGRFVKTNGTGYVFDGSYEQLFRIVGDLRRDEALVLGKRALSLWEEEYSTLRERQVEAFFHQLGTLVRS